MRTEDEISHHEHHQGLHHYHGKHWGDTQNAEKDADERNEPVGQKLPVTAPAPVGIDSSPVEATAVKAMKTHQAPWEQPKNTVAPHYAQVTINKAAHATKAGEIDASPVEATAVKAMKTHCAPWEKQEPASPKHEYHGTHFTVGMNDSGDAATKPVASAAEKFKAERKGAPQQVAPKKTVTKPKAQKVTPPTSIKKKETVAKVDKKAGMKLQVTKSAPVGNAHTKTPWNMSDDITHHAHHGSPHQGLHDYHGKHWGDTRSDAEKERDAHNAPAGIDAKKVAAARVDASPVEATAAKALKTHHAPWEAPTQPKPGHSTSKNKVSEQALDADVARISANQPAAASTSAKDKNCNIM